MMIQLPWTGHSHSVVVYSTREIGTDWPPFVNWLKVQALLSFYFHFPIANHVRAEPKNSANWKCLLAAIAQWNRLRLTYCDIEGPRVRFPFKRFSFLMVKREESPVNMIIYVILLLAKVFLIKNIIWKRTTTLVTIIKVTWHFLMIRFGA